MRDELITVETGILARKVKKKESGIYDVPTQSSLQRWIRDDKKIMVWVYPVSKDNAEFVLWNYKNY